MRSESIAQLVTALSKAQGEFPEIPKSSTVNAGKFSYDYAPLDVVLKTVRPALAANELSLIQRIDEGEQGSFLEVTLAHSSGEFITSYKKLGQIDDVKAFGSAMTYYRRYLIEGLLGVASEKDYDGERTEPQQPQTNGAQPKVKKGTTANDVKMRINENLPAEHQFSHVAHLRNAIRKHSGLEDFDWPGPFDSEDWAQVFEWCKEIIDEKAAIATQETLPE